MRNKDFCRLMLEQEKQKRSNGDESTADLYRATRNHFAAFIREGGKSGLLGDVTQDVVQEFVLYLKGKKLRVNSMNSYISNLRAMYNRACRGWKGRPEERPFEGMQLQREETVKRAVPVEVIKQMAALDLEEEPEKKLAVDMAKNMNLPLYATNLVCELFKTAQVKGYGKLDNCAIIKLYEELGGVEVRG